MHRIQRLVDVFHLNFPPFVETTLIIPNASIYPLTREVFFCTFVKMFLLRTTCGLFFSYNAVSLITLNDAYLQLSHTNGNILSIRIEFVFSL